MNDQQSKGGFSIGETRLTHGLMLAPMAGVTDAAQTVWGGWLMERLFAEGSALAEMPKGHISVKVEAMKRQLQQMLSESGVALYTNCTLILTQLNRIRIKDTNTSSTEKI